MWTTGEKVAFTIVGVGTVILLKVSWKLRGVPMPVQQTGNTVGLLEAGATQALGSSGVEAAIAML